MTDQEIFNGIIRKDNQVFLYMYKEYSGNVRRMVMRHKGREEDALDIFQEGLLCLWTNIKTGRFELRENTKISSYFHTLCRNIWINKMRKEKATLPLANQQLVAPEEESDTEEEKYRQLKVLEANLQKLDTACRQMLTFFYYQKLSLRQIAKLMGLTEKTAKNNKYRCMQKLRTHY